MSVPGVGIAVPFPLIGFVNEDGLRPSTAALQNTAGDRAITNCQRVGITECVALLIAIDVHHRINTIFQLASNKRVKIRSVDGFVNRPVCNILKLHIGYIVEIDVQMLIHIIGRIDNFPIRFYFIEHISVCVFIMFIAI